VIGVLMAWVALPWFVRLVEFGTEYVQPGGGIAAQIANSHTLFNVLSAVIFLPLTRQYVKFLETVIRGKDEDLEMVPVYTDKLLLDTPVAAMKAAILESARTAGIARRMFDEVMTGFHKNDAGSLEKAEHDENTLNDLQKQVTQYIVELSKRPLSHSESGMVPTLISGINNVERIGDHSLSIARLAYEKMEKNLQFSKEAMDDLLKMEKVIIDMFERTITILESGDSSRIHEVEKMEDEIDRLSEAVQKGHAERLEQGTCTVEAGLIFLDVINYLERIADHIVKVCVALGSFYTS